MTTATLMVKNFICNIYIGNGNANFRVFRYFISMRIIFFIAYYSRSFDTTFHLGPSFLSHIDGDTLDLVSMNDLVVRMI